MDAIVGTAIIGLVALNIWLNMKFSSLGEENKKLKEKVFHDSLTGLPNKTMFMDRLKLKLSHAQRYDEKICVMFLDLDGFKAVNDTHGHDIGDQVLKIIATRINECTRESDTVARFGGDEFGIILPEAHFESDILLVAKRLIEHINEPILLNNNSINVGVSIGVSFSRAVALTPEQIIKTADTAMYQSKANGKNSYTIHL